MARTRTLSERDADETAIAEKPNTETVVDRFNVPRNRVWAAKLNEPLYAAIPHVQETAVDENATTQITLNDVAARVPYMSSFYDGNGSLTGPYTLETDIVTFFDSTGNGRPDSLVTGSSTVQYDSVSYDADTQAVTDITYEDTSGNSGTKNITILAMTREGTITIQRSAANDKARDSMQSNDSIEHVYSNPYSATSDSGIEFDDELAGKQGVVAPKQSIDILYDGPVTNVSGFTEKVDGVNTNAEIRIPIVQRRVRDDEDPNELRREIREQMSEA